VITPSVVVMTMTGEARSVVLPTITWIFLTRLELLLEL